MKTLIDANVILRYLLGDHPQMSEQARRVIQEGTFTLPEVLAEVVYVLQGVYHVGRKEISETLIEFLDETDMESQETMVETLCLYSETTLDFVDCILIAHHRISGDAVISFDKKLNKLL